MFIKILWITFVQLSFRSLSQIPETWKDPLGSFLEPPKLENHRPSSKTLYNKLDVLYQIYSCILLWIDCIKHLKISSKPRPQEPSLWTLSLGPPKHKKHRPSSKTLYNKLAVMFKFIHILLWIDCIKHLKISSKPRPPEGPFFGPCLWDPENTKSTDPQVRLFITNLILYSNLFIHSIMNRLHKRSKDLFKAQTPRTQSLDLVSGTPKTRKAQTLK